MVGILVGFIIGCVIGWIGSMVMRTDSQGGILADIAAGGGAGTIAAIALGDGYVADSLCAGSIGAAVVIAAIVLFSRWSPRL
jgi:uncharacterized membrane protein YeaQ/YmgE (transglycosylase-associated protein family)